MVFEMKFSSDIYRIILYYKHSAVMRHKTCGSCEETFYFPTLFQYDSHVYKQRRHTYLSTWLDYTRFPISFLLGFSSSVLYT